MQSNYKANCAESALTKSSLLSGTTNGVDGRRSPDRNGQQMSARTTQKLSVCLLTYNHEHAIGAVLDSVLAQTYRDFELIVSDDSSTDRTWGLIQAMAARDARVRPVRTPRNLGMAKNANFAVGLAAGEYIVLLHHDDIVAPSLFAKWLAVAVESRQTGFVFNDYNVSGVASHASEGRRFERHMDGRRFLRKHLLGGWGCPVRGTALINKACFDAVGGLAEEFSLLADIDLWMRLAERWDVGYVSEPLIEVGQQRPRDYPEEYITFSWQRLRLLFDIHAAGISAVARRGRICRRLTWWKFRNRVSIEAGKWLLYGVVRGNHAMSTRAREGANDYEWWPVRVFREVVARIGQIALGSYHSSSNRKGAAGSQRKQDIR